MSNSNGIDPIVERAIFFLEGAIAKLRQGNKYNQNGYQYKDYMFHGFDTCVDRVLESLLRVKTAKSIDDAIDSCGYMGLDVAYILAGEPESKIKIRVLPAIEIRVDGEIGEMTGEAPKNITQLYPSKPEEKE